MRNLITAQEVIDLAFAENSNMMAESISDTAIRIAEIKYIRPAFGVMYPLLADKYADYTNDYVKPALAYFVKCEIVSSIAIDMSNSGVAVANPQYQSAASDKQRQRLYDSEMSKAKTLLDFALEYIAENKELFPDFNGEAPKKHHRLGGLLLGDRTSRNQSASIAGEAFNNELKQLSKEVSSKVDKVDGKGLSTNDFTDEYKKKVDELGEGGGASITIDTELDETSNNAIANSAVTRGFRGLSERLNEKVEPKADKKGYYKDMSVGMADNLVGRGDVQDAQINFRPSAGADTNITDGAARIERIKGNSVVYNQLISNSRFETARDYNTAGGATLNVDGGIATITLGTSNYSGVTNIELNSKLLVGHKYLLITEAKADAEMQNVLIPYVLSASASPKNTVSTEWRSYSFVKEATSATMSYGVARANTYGTDFQSGDKIYAKSFRVIDLTQMFGADNEPTTVEEYHQRKPMNIEDEFAYNAGTLVDMKVDSLISTSDNAYDYVNGYARVMGGVPYTFTIDNRKDITPEEVFFSESLPVVTNEENIIAPNADGTYTYPSNGYTNASFAGYEVGRKDTICVCLKHSYDKPHPAHQPDVKDLSFISEAFSNGMRSAGSTFDEIRFNPTKKVWEKVERVGVRAYAEGDAEDSSVTTDGKTTNYPLDNPTPTTIDLSPNFNLDYLVWDFGTEEAIVPNNVPSAPFRADINYEPNAVDDLRWAVSEIRNLKAQLAQMQTSVTNLTE